MRSAFLSRTQSDDEGTFGVLTTDSGFECATGELPWRDNKPLDSCIPEGDYICNWRSSPTHGFCYHIEGVAGRSNVEIHAANFMGDRARGFRCELKGCIAPGKYTGVMENQMAIIDSREALTELEEDLNHESFQLTIEKSNFLLIKD